MNGVSWSIRLVRFPGWPRRYKATKPKLSPAQVGGLIDLVEATVGRAQAELAAAARLGG